MERKKGLQKLYVSTEKETGGKVRELMGQIYEPWKKKEKVLK